MSEGPKTLGQYRDLFALLAGEDNDAVKFLDRKITEQGRDEIVIAPESQMLALLASMIKKETT